MKNLKSIITALSLVLLTGAVNAQKTESTPEQRAAQKTENMVKTLSLTPEQKPKVAELNLGVAQKNEAIKNNPNMTPEQKKEAYKGNEEGRKVNLQTILTPEQYQKYLDQSEKRASKVETAKQRKEMPKKMAPIVKEKQ
jgi:Tfp pilus assembly protein PilV